MPAAPLGVILAGGASTRMGSDKALVEINGEPMIRFVATALRAVCDEVVVVGRSGLLDGLACLPDLRGGRLGPAAGIATGLAAASGRPILVLGVDQPYVRVDTLRAIAALGEEEAVVPHDEVLQITCAYYPQSFRAAAEAALDEGRPVWRTLRALPMTAVEPARWRSWGEDGRSWYSVDTPDSLAVGLARYGVPGAWPDQ